MCSFVCMCSHGKQSPLSSYQLFRGHQFKELFDEVNESLDGPGSLHSPFLCFHYRSVSYSLQQDVNFKKKKKTTVLRHLMRLRWPTFISRVHVISTLELRQRHKNIRLFHYFMPRSYKVLPIGLNFKTHFGAAEF